MQVDNLTKHLFCSKQQTKLFFMSDLDSDLEIHLLKTCIIAIVIILPNSKKKLGGSNAYLKKKCLLSFCKKKIIPFEVEFKPDDSLDIN